MVIDKIKKVNNIKVISKRNTKASDMLIGKWAKCDNCKEIIYKDEIRKNLSVCPNCGKHFRLSSRRRIKQIIDEGTFIEIAKGLQTKDPLKFEGYTKKLETLKEKTKIEEAVVAGIGEISGSKVVIAIMDGNFLMGSMGSVVGEKITLAVEEAIKQRLPLIIFCVSGGARMQEGIISLMQMAKISQAIARHDSKGLLYLSIITNPTTGGVTASFAMQGDMIIAEPGAIIGFAGRRVIENTIRQKLPDEFQTSEFAVEKGFVDSIVKRHDMKNYISKTLSLHGVCENV